MSTNRYPMELKDRAVRMVLEHQQDYPSKYAAVKMLAAKLDVGGESLRIWVRKAEVDAGARAGVTSQESTRVKELEREVKELKRANEILKVAAYFFAREFDRHVADLSVHRWEPATARGRADLQSAY